MKDYCENINFGVFLAAWNGLQSLTTPALHFWIANWLEESWRHGNKRLMMNAFRGSGKSTLAALFSAWVLCKDPDLRFLVLAAESSLARKLLRNTKKVIEKHPLTRHLKPEAPDQWSAEQFTIQRTRVGRDPSFIARGITSNITGIRADIIICDDVEVPNTCGTTEKRRDLRERLNELEFILTPQGTLIYLGTPHSWYSIYAAEPRTEIGEERAFLDGYKRLYVPVLNKRGESVWPERFTLESIEEQKRKSGPNAFASQMMVRPINILNGRLDPLLLKPYKAELEYSEAQKQIQLSLMGRKIVSASAWWDPAFGSAGGDKSVLAVVYTDEEGEYWLHHLRYIKPNKDDDDDEATQQCKIVAALAGRFFLPSICIETNGIGKFLPAILRRELAAAGIACAVIEKSSSLSKDMRILEAFDAVLAARALNIHRSIYDTPFLNEMQEWRIGGTRKGHDDGLDAVAGALLQEPVRLKRTYADKYSKGWRTESHAAKTDFSV